MCIHFHWRYVPRYHQLLIILDFKEKEVKGVRFVDEVSEVYNVVPMKEIVADSEGHVISELAVEQVKKNEVSSPGIFYFLRIFLENSEKNFL
jgi:hypothetical protein